MTIDIQALELGERVDIGATDRDKLFVGDSLKSVWFIAEGVEDDGTPIVPALFATDNSGWAGSIELEGSPFVATVSGFDDTGEVTINIAPDVSIAGRHRYRIRATNAAIPAKRYIMHGTIVVSTKYPA